MSNHDIDWEDFFQAINHPVLILDKSHIVLAANHAAEKFMNRDLDQIVGRQCYELVHDPKSTQPPACCPSQILLKDGIAQTVEMEMELFNGYALVSCTPVLDEEGDLDKIIHIVTDITKRRNVEQELKKSQNQLSGLISNLPGVVYHCKNDKNWTMDYLSDQFTKLTGYDPKDVIGNNELAFNDIIHPDDRLMVWETIQEALSGDRPYQMNYRIITRDKDIKWVWERGFGVWEEGQLVLEGIIEDITETKLVLDALKESEKLFREFIQQAGDAIFISDLEGRFKVVNDKACNLLGYGEEELLKMTIADVEAQFNQEDILDAVEQLKNVGNLTFESKHLHKDGSHIPVEVNVKLMDIQGEKLILNIVRDISERKTYLKALEDSEMLYRAIFENTGAGTSILNEEGLITMANTEMELLSGYNRREVENKMFWREFIPPKEREIMMEYECIRQENPATPPSRYESKFIKKDGEVRNMMVTVDYIPKSSKRVVSVLDITDLHNAEESLKQSLQEKEILLREVHHRVKNNMQIISSLLNLQRQFVDEPETMNLLKESQGRIKAMAMIHEKLYQSTDFSRIKFKDYLEKLISDIFYSYGVSYEVIKPRIELEGQEIGMETAIPLGLIINELVTNSIKYAFPNGKTGHIIINLKSEHDKHVLTLADNGVGLPDDIDINDTNTLGLQMVNSLVRQLDGVIELNDSEGVNYTISFQEIDYPQRI